jgi:SAM-dependent methyltransferase
MLTVALARRHRDWSVVGVDLSAQALRLAREEAQRAGLENAAFEQADLTADLGTKRYDAIAAIECLEEIPDDAAAIKAMARALRPGGLLVVHAPERSWTPVLAGSEQTWRHEVRHGYGAEELAELIGRAGLEVGDVRPTSRGTVRLAQELRDRMRRSSLRGQAIAYPLIVAAVPLERWGLTWGPARALLVEASR